ncbi:MAG TPA: phospholipid carrier-dependent glycosyltransferase [Candidatus Limnocylindria bacterium]
MTRDSVRERGAWPFGLRVPRDPATAVILIIVAGVLLRVLLAGVLLPLSGFRIDVVDFSAWAQRLADGGPGAFYETGYFSDYPPGYLYVLWVIGSVGKALQPLTFGVDVTPGLVKLPGLLADVGVAWLLFAYCRRFLPGLGGWSGERIGMIAAAIYVLNPGTIFNSAVWGQVDSVGALVVLGTLYLLARGWTEAASVAAVLALLVKFQYAFVIPIVAIVGIKRHLFGRSTDPELDGRPDPLRVLTSLAAGLGTLVGLIWPFGMAVWSPSQPSHSLIDKFVAAANQYKGLTINGFNWWRNPWSGLGDTITWGCDAPNPPGCTDGAGIAFTIGSSAVSWQLVGTVLFVLVALVAYWYVARRDDAVGLLDASLVLAVAFFALPTRVHERYLFPALALAAPLVARGWRWAVLYGLLALSFFANVYWVYTADWSFAGDPPMNPGVGGLPMTRDPFLAGTLFSDWGIYLLSWMSLLLLGLLVWRTSRLAWRGVPLPERAPLAAAAGPPPQAVGAPSVDDLPVADPGGYEGGPLERLRAWLRPDPSDPYLREKPRRLDRLDVALVIGLVLLAFAFRLWRLDTPRGMHFDEVYHARSATEWLADWQEGWTRDTYEWTHPMLAKYLIAAGIVLADPNKVVAATEVEEPISALAIAPQRTAYSRPISVAFTAAGGTTITARNAVSGEVIARWDAPAAVASLGYDPDSERLLVGPVAGGDVTIYDLAAFLSSRGERSPPPVTQSIPTGLAGVVEIQVPDAQAVVLFRGPDGLVEVERVTGAELARSEIRAGGMGYLPGTSSDDAEGPMVVVTDMDRGVLAVLDGGTLQPLRAGTGDRIEELPAPPVGPLALQGGGNDLQVFVLVGALPANDQHPAVEGGMAVFDQRVNLIDTAPLPGAPKLIGWQAASDASVCGSAVGGCGWLIYVAGDDASSGQPAVWAVQPIGTSANQASGFAAFDTTLLPGEPTAMAFDVNNHDQDDDHARLLVATDGGQPHLVQVDVGSNAFAWRLAGIAFGSILVALIYLLAATMFRRRRIAVLAAAFVAFDAMSYVMSRISMNDIFVAVFIAAAYLLFWQIWSGRWARSAWWVLPVVGVLIGLAAATKWVGIYALLGLWVLVLARSRLGRFLLVAAVAFLAVVGGIGAPWPFLVVCLAALAIALLVVWQRPIQLDMRDLGGLAASGVVLGGIGLAFAMAFNQVPGASEPRSAVELVFSVLARGTQAAWPAWIMVALAGVLLLARAVLSLARPTSDRRWLQPGEMAGFAWPWIGASLAVIPLVVYFLSYVPYLELGHAISGAKAGPGYGWALDQLQFQMFGYHFGLQAGHASASPWWSWPLDLKPVWFYGHDMDNRTIAVVYNGGNPILFWAGVPAIAFCAVMAWKRRSPALVLLVVAFAFQFLPWTRIERATFAYHYLTAVIFAMVAVAYVVDEALRSWNWRPFAIAFLVLAVIAGILVYPMGAALAMPDWYINQARALPPWNYAFKFPDPPQGDRGQLISADSLKLALGALVALSAAAFALFGRSWLAGPAAHRDGEQDEAEQDEAYRPQQVAVDARDELVDQEPGPQADQDQPEDHPA